MDLDVPPNEEMARQAQRDLLRSALEAPIPKFYCNGFINGNSAADVVTVLQVNGQPVAVLNMSFTVAKSLSIALGQAIANVEGLSGKEMLTISEIDNLMKKSGKPVIRSDEKK